MIAPAPTLSICAAIFIWAAESHNSSFAELAEEQTIQCDGVPAAVRSAFKKMLPEATVRSCVREEEMGKSAYEVTSTDGEITRDVLFDANGALLVVEEEIAATALPKAVAQSWEKRFPNHTIVLAEKVDAATTMSRTKFNQPISVNYSKLSSTVTAGADWFNFPTEIA